MRAFYEQPAARRTPRAVVVNRQTLKRLLAPPWWTREKTRFVSWTGLAVALCLHAFGAAALAMWQEPQRPEAVETYTVALAPDLGPVGAAVAAPTVVVLPTEKLEETRSEAPAIPEPPPAVGETKSAGGGSSDAAPTPPVLSDIESSNYWENVRMAVARTVRYPPAAIEQGVEGTIDLRLTIDARGNLVSAVPLNGSPDVLVQSALSAARRASPFPSQESAGAELTAVLPVHFQLSRDNPKRRTPE